MIEPTIRDAVPIPARRGPGRPPSEKWKFLRELDVDQSAYFELDQFDSVEEMRKFRSTMSAMASQYAKRTGKAFTVRTDEAGVGIWRIE